MALLACPDCGRAVSASAPACPGCGRPICGANHLPAPSRAPYVQPVERTGKTWKSIGCLSSLILLIAVGIFVATAAQGAPAWWALPAAIVALVLRTIASIGAWWYHA